MDCNNMDWAPDDENFFLNEVQFTDPIMNYQQQQQQVVANSQLQQTISPQLQPERADSGVFYQLQQVYNGNPMSLYDQQWQRQALQQPLAELELPASYQQHQPQILGNTISHFQPEWQRNPQQNQEQFSMVPQTIYQSPQENNQGNVAMEFITELPQQYYFQPETAYTTQSTICCQQQQAVGVSQSQSQTLVQPAGSFVQHPTNVSQEQQTPEISQKNALNNKPIIKSVEILPPGTYSLDGVLQRPTTRGINKTLGQSPQETQTQMQVATSQATEVRVQPKTEQVLIEKSLQIPQKQMEMTQHEKKSQEKDLAKSITQEAEEYMIISNTKFKMKKPVQVSMMARDMFKDMAIFGVSVLDTFLGTDLSSKVYTEVRNLHASGVFQDGLVGTLEPQVKKPGRGDKVTWVTGRESNCEHIGMMIDKLHAIIRLACARGPNGLLMGKYKVSGSTQAMVACYPGKKTLYRKHVDNAKGDGRLLTAIYYLNPDWTQKSGGILRLYPSVKEGHIDVFPYFDRLIFFWSDARNPHEVLPAYDTRYAITVWYFEAEEREKALKDAEEYRKIKQQHKQSKSASTSAAGANSSGAVLGINDPCMGASLHD